jgi:hypothetical protein
MDEAKLLPPFQKKKDLVLNADFAPEMFLEFFIALTYIFQNFGQLLKIFIVKFSLF